MIDLSEKGLPNAIEVGGEPFLIKTDYREWLKFGELLKHSGNKLHPRDLIYLFVDDIPDQLDFVDELLAFYVSPEVTPKDDGTGEKSLVDFILDGSYIYASFMAVYGIDLVDTDMHWHKFKALFQGMPDDACIKNIMAIRGYKKSNKSLDKCQQEAKELWTLPEERMTTEKEQEINREINDLFYNA